MIKNKFNLILHEFHTASFFLFANRLKMPGAKRVKQEAAQRAVTPVKFLADDNEECVFEKAHGAFLG